MEDSGHVVLLQHPHVHSARPTAKKMTTKSKRGDIAGLA